MSKTLSSAGVKQPNDRTVVPKSAFRADGFDTVTSKLSEKIQKLYLSDDLPWVVGYSGGKDSTATLQLVWNAVRSLSEGERVKPIHVISTDTLVENPIVAKWVDHSLEAMREASAQQRLPVVPHRLTPELRDRYWVKLIGWGYPAPRQGFRWCTSRLKINPSNKFITELADSHGEAILVLGSRKMESAARSRVIASHEGSTRDLLSRNSNPKLDRVWVFCPIVDWSNDDVWEYLTLVENPWGYPNRDLLSMYRGATADNECPLVVDSSTPSCGDSRFGCFVCTLVDKDKSMQAMIQNDEEKQWMKPLVDFRNTYLNIDRAWEWHRRDFRRMDRSLKLFDSGEGLIHGPYKQGYREELLRELLKAQDRIRKTGPEAVRRLELISLEELDEIRRVWVREKHEIEDRLPRIFEEALGEPYPNSGFDEGQVFQPEDLHVLRSLAASSGDSEGLHFELTRELLHIEQSFRTASRRVGLYSALEKALEDNAFDSENEALEFARERRSALLEGQLSAKETTPETYLSAESDAEMPEEQN